MVMLRPQLAREINSNAEEEILGVHLFIWMLCYSILIILFWYNFFKLEVPNALSFKPVFHVPSLPNSS